MRKTTQSKPNTKRAGSKLFSFPPAETPKKRGRRPGNAWAGAGPHFDYVAGVIPMECRPSDGPPDGVQYQSLNGIFEIAIAAGVSEERKLFLTRATRERLAKLLNLTKPLDPDSEIGTKVTIALMELLYVRKPAIGGLIKRLETVKRDASAFHRLFGDDPHVLNEQQSTYVLSRADLAHLKRFLADFDRLAGRALEIQGAIAPILAEIREAKPEFRAAQAKRFRRILDHVARRMTHWSPEPVESRALTCNYRTSTDAEARRVPIAVAAIEILFLMTQEDWVLPTKAALFRKIEEIVLGGRRLNAPLRSKIVKQTGLENLERKNTW